MPRGRLASEFVSPLIALLVTAPMPTTTIATTGGARQQHWSMGRAVPAEVYRMEGPLGVVGSPWCSCTMAVRAAVTTDSVLPTRGRWGWGLGRSRSRSPGRALALALALALTLTFTSTLTLTQARQLALDRACCRRQRQLAADIVSDGLCGVGSGGGEGSGSWAASSSWAAGGSWVGSSRGMAESGVGGGSEGGDGGLPTLYAPLRSCRWSSPASRRGTKGRPPTCQPHRDLELSASSGELSARLTRSSGELLADGGLSTSGAATAGYRVQGTVYGLSTSGAATAGDQAHRSGSAYQAQARSRSSGCQHGVQGTGYRVRGTGYSRSSGCRAPLPMHQPARQCGDENTSVAAAPWLAWVPWLAGGTREAATREAEGKVATVAVGRAASPAASPSGGVDSSAAGRTRGGGGLWALMMPWVAQRAEEGGAAGEGETGGSSLDSPHTMQLKALQDALGAVARQVHRK